MPNNTLALPRIWNVDGVIIEVQVQKQTLISQSIKKHGIDSFVFTHYADAFDLECAQDIERMLIAEHNTKTPFGYNMTDGGEGTLGMPAPNKGKKFSEESIQKMRNAKLGKKSTDEARRNQSLALKGMKKSEDHKKKIGLAQKGVACPQRGRSGKTVSDEVKKSWVIWEKDQKCRMKPSKKLVHH